MPRHCIGLASPVAVWLAFGAVGCFPDHSFADVADSAADSLDLDGTADTPLDASPDRPVVTENMQLVVPEPAAFSISARRVFTEESVSTSARLSRAFYMDRYEVTTGRFKAWLDAEKRLPCDGCTLDEGGPYETQMVWDASWTTEHASLPPDEYSGCYTGQQPEALPWVASARDENWAYPMTCVTWYEAAAFCYFEGKRLPTHAEWIYAARGGGASKSYPWGNNPPSDCASATYNVQDSQPEFCGFPVQVGTAASDSTISDIHDMAGSVLEWVWDLDWTVANVPSEVVDFAGPQEAITNPPARVQKGGAYFVPINHDENDTRMQIDVFDSVGVREQYGDTGFRCVRSAPAD